MLKVIMTKGLPGAGKDYWATEFMVENPGKFKRVNKDMLRAMLDNSAYSKQNEELVLTIRNFIILRSLQAGFNVIVTDTNIHPVHEKTITKLVAGIAEVEVVYFKVPLDVCIERDSKRSGHACVGKEVISRMAYQWAGFEPEVFNLEE